MYALTVSTQKQLERATLRAQAQKPKIEEIAFGMYKVWSSNPQTPWLTYSTGIEAAPDGGYSVCCSCPTKNYFCKHLAAIFPHFLMRVKELEAQEPEQEPVHPVCTICGEEAHVWNGKEWLCWDHAFEKAPDPAPVITTSIQEIDDLIEQAIEESLDRECPECGLVQPDDDSTDCLCCGAILNPDDIDETASLVSQELACKDCGAPATGGEGRCEACDLRFASKCLFG
jgi:hypothetical protein